MSKQQNIPSDAPPAYDAVVGGSSNTAGASHSANSTLHVPGQSSSSRRPDILSQRRSMEDEARPLPQGWVRTYDPESHHQFFVDTTKDPPKSIWHHPYDDEEYLSTLSSEEREKLEHESEQRARNPSKEDIMIAHSDEDDEHDTHTGGKSFPNELPPRSDGKGKDQGGKRSFGRKFKDKVTGTTHEERARDRERRAQKERELIEQHKKIREAMVEAMRIGAPVKIGQDKDGKDVFVEPPPRDPYAGGYPNDGFGGIYGSPTGAVRDPYINNGNGYSPYNTGTYSTPDARYIRPSAPYSRPYRRGYGMPLALGAGGGLLGGFLLADALDGGFGGMGMGGMGMGMGGMGMGGMGMGGMGMGGMGGMGG